MEITIIKRYSTPVEAYIDAGLLRDNDIECAVDGDTVVSTLPYLMCDVTLSVRQTDADQARQLLHITSQD